MFIKQSETNNSSSQEKNFTQYIKTSSSTKSKYKLTITKKLV